MKKMKNLFLFDVDGTLTEGFDAHHQAFIGAFQEVFNINTKVEMYRYHGSTDLNIIYDVLTKNGISNPVIRENLEKIKDIMVKIYAKKVVNDDVKTLNGVLEVLALINDMGEGIGLVTGNLSKIARIKLKQAGIPDYFPIGGFGEISRNREDLVLNAIENANIHYNMNFKKENIYIIGDTPRDIEAALKAKVNAIGIATGKYNKNELNKKEPTYLFNDLIEFGDLIKKMFI